MYKKADCVSHAVCVRLAEVDEVSFCLCLHPKIVTRITDKVDLVHIARSKNFIETHVTIDVCTFE